MKNKVHDEGTEKPDNTSETAKLVNEEFMTAKPTIKGTDQGHWDDICKLVDQMKFLFTYRIGEVVVKNGDERYLIPGVYYAPEVTLNVLSIEQLERQGVEIIYEDNTCRLIWKILGLSIQDGEEVKNCYIKYLDVFTCYYKTARVPKQEHSPVLDIPTEIVEEGKEYTCLTSRQCDIAEIKAPSMETANRKGKAKKIEHFGVKLEDITKESDSHHFQPIQHNIKGSLTLNKDIQGMIRRPTSSESTDKEDTSSSSSNDLIIIA
nr:ARID DNA-binding domain-containing protein [Tanacetum cinerariifolium]